MHLPRPRLRLRTLLIAVAVAGGVLGIFRWAIQVDRLRMADRAIKDAQRWVMEAEEDERQAREARAAGDTQLATEYEQSRDGNLEIARWLQNYGRRVRAIATRPWAPLPYVPPRPE